jgi:hypothetical protein
MKQFLVFFEKVSGDPADTEKGFRGRVVIQAEEQIIAVNEFLEWAKVQENFQDSSKFYFEISEIEHQL